MCRAKEIAMSRPKRFVTVLFGPLGDTLMSLALFDDIVRVHPDAELVILTRRSAAMVRALASEYKGVQVVEVQNSIRTLVTFAWLLLRRNSTLLMLGLSSAPLSGHLRVFLRVFAMVPGNTSVGFYDPALDVVLEYRVTERIYQNFRRMLPHAIKGWKGTLRLPSLNLPHKEPTSFPYGAGEFVVFHLFGTSIRHALPPKRWRALLEHMHKTHPSLGLVLTGTAAEREAIEAVSAGLPVHVVISASMPELVWIVDNAALYVGIDTGVTHVAGLLQQKSLIVRHCSDPSWIPDYNPNSRILLNSAHCTPDDPSHCVMVEEEGVQYRKCAYDISDAALRSSLDLGLSTSSRNIPGFAGLVDEDGAA